METTTPHPDTLELLFTGLWTHIPQTYCQSKLILCWRAYIDYNNMYSSSKNRFLLLFIMQFNEYNRKTTKEFGHLFSFDLPWFWSFQISQFQFIIICEIQWITLNYLRFSLCRPANNYLLSKSNGVRRGSLNWWKLSLLKKRKKEKPPPSNGKWHIFFQ